MVSCKLDTTAGKVKQGYSVPKKVFQTQDQTYGLTSNHKREYTGMGDLIHNTILKQTLADKIKKEVLSELVQKQLKNLKIDPGNKASQLRR